MITNIFAIIGAMALIRRYLFTFYEVSGDSMMPTLRIGQFLLVSKLSKIKEEDIIVFYLNKYGHGICVKRVKEIRDDGFFVHGDNKYLEITHIKEDERNLDSRIFGVVPFANVIGKAFPLI